ncbi:MAG: hypothetical protein AAF587_32090 [Bacteroidota bacterium]
MKQAHIQQSMESSILIQASASEIWDNITDVKIEEFSDPILFKLLDIPKPLKADVISEGKGGQRIAYFDSGKRFMQEILRWEPMTGYSFSFNPEKGFRVCYLFDLADGVFQIPGGAYRLDSMHKQAIRLTLQTTFSIDRRLYWLFILPVKLILKAFQRYLLRSIKRNSEP